MWILNQKEYKKLKLAEMHSWDHFTRLDISEILTSLQHWESQIYFKRYKDTCKIRKIILKEQKETTSTTGIIINQGDET
jgi:hypothetical protein